MIGETVLQLVLLRNKAKTVDKNKKLCYTIVAGDGIIFSAAIYRVTASVSHLAVKNSIPLSGGLKVHQISCVQSS